MQSLIPVLALLFALVPGAIIKKLSTGGSRSVRGVRRGLFIVAVLFGGAAMGSWVLTQADAAITPQEGPRIIAIIVGGTVAFVAALVTSALLGHRNEGLGIVIRRTILLIAVGCLCVLGFFVVTTGGRIFLFGPLPPTVLIISLGCTGLFWRTEPASRDAAPENLHISGH